MSAIDTEILAFLSIERTTEALFTDEEFRARVEAHLADVRARLELRNLVKNEARQARVVKITLLFGALIASLGGLKLYLGVMRAKPIAFLVTALLVTEVIVFSIFRKRKHLTRLGRDYLKNLRGASAGRGRGESSRKASTRRSLWPSLVRDIRM